MRDMTSVPPKERRKDIRKWVKEIEENEECECNDNACELCALVFMVKEYRYLNMVNKRMLKYAYVSTEDSAGQVFVTSARKAKSSSMDKILDEAEAAAERLAVLCAE